MTLVTARSGEVVYASCSRCGLTLSLRLSQPPVEHCPRCLARDHTLFAMALLRPGRLELEDDGHRGSHRLSLVGELDATTAGELEAQVAALCSRAASAIVLDLSRASTVDSRGLAALLLCRRRCESRGCEFSLTRGTAPVERLFDLFHVAR
jgi:anti-anti-sigma factor